MDTRRDNVVVVETWVPWPVSWSAIWVGALAAIALALLFGLGGIALGVHLLGPSQRIVDWRKFTMGALIFSVCGAFFSGCGWGLGRWQGRRYSTLGTSHAPRGDRLARHGAAPARAGRAGRLAVTLAGGMVALLGKRSGLRPCPARPPRPARHSSGGPRGCRARSGACGPESALGAITALLLGLVGSVVGGWMASGEPLMFTIARGRSVPRRGRREDAPSRSTMRKEGSLWDIS